ncbi:MAG: glycosyltransferase family 29 protein [Lentilitoribacter sp.]
MIWFSQFIFSFRKTLQGDKYLTQLSLSEDELHSLLEGKTVAIVGNARSLETQNYGAEIDAHDIVIRLNDAPIIAAASHGRRTDWMAVAKHISKQTLQTRNPDLLLWMPAHRKRLGWRMVNYSKFYLNSPERNDELKAKLGASSSVGCKTIDLIRRTNAAKVTLYGFDFFASLSLSGDRTADQVPHNFSAEKEIVEELMEGDERFALQQ